MRRIIALCLVGLVASTHAGTHQIEGRVVGVHDGDTIALLPAERRACNIRLVAERRYGELLKELARATPGDRRSKESVSPEATLIDVSQYAEALQRDGISRQGAARFQALADASVQLGQVQRSGHR